MTDSGCVWLFACRSKFVDAGLACGLKAVRPFFDKSAAAAAVCGAMCYMPLPMYDLPNNGISF